MSATTSTPATTTPATAPRHRVVIADDTVALRTLARTLLEESGRFDVVAEAGTGAEAVALAGEHQPDVVLLDLAMPVMDGLEALPHVRSRAPHAKVVVVSGFDGARMSSIAVERGARLPHQGRAAPAPPRRDPVGRRRRRTGRRRGRAPALRR